MTTGRNIKRTAVALGLLLWAVGSVARADSLSDFTVLAETSHTLIASVAYTYDSLNGDCVRASAVGNLGGLGHRKWPVRAGSGHLYVELGNPTASAFVTTEVKVRLEPCDGPEFFSETFSYTKLWAPDAGDLITRNLYTLSQDPKFLFYEVDYQFNSSHSIPVRLWPRIFVDGGNVPFPVATSPSPVLPVGSSGRTTGTVSYPTFGTNKSDAVLLELREDGGSPFHITIVPRTKYWSDDSTDTDLDKIGDSNELALGTDPANEDSDGDGLEDGHELEGYQWTDGLIWPEVNLPYWGADPLHKDVFVEVDYVEDGGIDQSMHLDSIYKVKETYEATEVPNPDGDKGILVHIFNDEAIPSPGSINGVCGQRDWIEFFPDRKNRIYHWAIAGPGEGGQGEVISNHFVFGTGNGNPGMDTRSKFMAFAVFSHELGHNLGLIHEGRDGSAQTNCKPNYFSMMNYAYDYAYNCGGLNLATTQIRFSDGSAPVLDLTALDEQSPPAPLGPLVGFEADWPSIGCDVFNWSGASGASIDWDQDSIYDATPVSVSTSLLAPACGDEGAKPDQRDSNDFETLELYIGESIVEPRRASCAASGPANGWSHDADTPELQPACGIPDYPGEVNHPWLRPNPVFTLLPAVQITHPQMQHELGPHLGPNGDLQDISLLDLDQDGKADVDDNCVDLFNPSQADANQDGIGDDCACGDADGNGMLQAADAFVIASCVTNPQNCLADVAIADTDNNGVLQAGDAFAVANHVTDPTLPQQDLTCANRPLGLQP